MALQAQAGGLALEQGLEAALVRHCLVHLHVGGRLVPAPHPAAAHAARRFDAAEQRLDGFLEAGQLGRLHPVVHVIVGHAA
jgi:hypothetical protein